LRELNEKHGITIIVVEQKIMLLSEYVRKLAVMSHGRIIFNGLVRDVMKKSSELEKCGINCPRVVTLSNRLKAMGIDTGDVCINVDEAEVMTRRLIHG